MKNLMIGLLALLTLSLPGFAQLAQEDLEFGGGYQHYSGDNGLDGYSLTAGWKPVPNFELTATYDSVYDTSTIGAFTFTSLGQVLINSHLLDVLLGPRYFLPGVFKSAKGRVKGHLLIPWAEAQFGEARLHTRLNATNFARVDSADTAFAWGLGGGADFRVFPHFAIRGNLGFMRTHFAGLGQSRVRIGLGVIYSLRAREIK